MLLEITSLSLFLNAIQILTDGIVFNDRFEYVYFRWFSALHRIVSCLLNRPYIIKYLINITVI
ncbi:hypothetical protein CQW35_02816 [Bacteroides fragilis]|nr:hypothetical protein CQW35_02816 [Bacteroides fragilis]